MNTLFLEIFSEEIPALLQTKAAQNLAESVMQRLAESLGELSTQNYKTFVTPRRIGFYFSGLPAEVTTREEVIRGPRLNAPPAALQGFLRKYGLNDVNELAREGEFYTYRLQNKVTDMPVLLKQIIEAALKNYVWPQSMRWGNNKDRWVRPIHAISCLWNNEVIPVQFAGITASNKTFGHRFMAPQEISFNSYEEYCQEMDKAFVILEPEAREEIICTAVEKIANPLNLKWHVDAKLLQEVAGLVECPTVYLGQIKAKFMQLPKEVLLTVLRNHQRYLMLEDESGAIAPYFLIIANIKAADEGKQIIEGNIKVLEARLEDAAFFMMNDQKAKLSSRVGKLANLVFHVQIGNVYEHIMQIQQLAEKLANIFAVNVAHVSRAAYLAKADLTSEMVGEFPELQGIMGSYYALNDGEELEVATAIAEHYKPQGMRDSLPTSKIGAVVAIADKLCTLNAFFSHGIKPSGSKDPYALRRAAIGIIRILEQFGWSLPENIPMHEDVLPFIVNRQS